MDTRKHCGRRPDAAPRFARAPVAMPKPPRSYHASAQRVRCASHETIIPALKQKNHNASSSDLCALRCHVPHVSCVQVCDHTPLAASHVRCLRERTRNVSCRRRARLGTLRIAAISCNQVRRSFLFRASVVGARVATLLACVATSQSVRYIMLSPRCDSVETR